jgi:hypothetical protein
MSLQKSSSHKAIKILTSSHPGIVILEQGPNPTNALQTITSITNLTHSTNTNHLLDPLFNVTATHPNPGNKLHALRSKLTTQRQEDEKQEIDERASTPPLTSTPSPRKPEKTTSPPSSARPPTTVKHEFTPHTNATSNTIVTYSADGPISTTVSASAHYFSNPLDPTNLAGTAEDPDLQRERMFLWTFISACCYYHTHLLTGLRTGDCAGAVQSITRFGLNHGPHDTLDAVTAMTQLSKQGIPWHDFTAKVSKIRSALDRETNANMQIGSQLLPGFILRAVDFDKTYAVELSLIRCTTPPPGVDHIMSTLGDKARSLVKHVPLSGNLGTVTPPITTLTASGQQICRAFAANNHCKFHDPSKGRFCKHSHGPAADKQTAIDKALYKPRHRVKPAAAATAAAAAAPPPSDSCYRCGSKLHGIDDCTEEVRGNVAAIAATGDSAPAPDLQTMSTLMSFARQLQAAKVPPPTTTINGMFADPLGVGPSTAAQISTMDNELAKLFGSISN